MKAKILKAGVIKDADTIAAMAKRYVDAEDYATAIDLMRVVLNLRLQATYYPEEEA